MEIGINLYPKWPYREVIAAFLENGIRRTFVNIEHPEFEAAMAALAKAGITVDNFHAPFKNLNVIWEPGQAGDEMLNKLLSGVDACVRYGVPLMVGHVSNGSPMPPISPEGLATAAKRGGRSLPLMDCYVTGMHLFSHFL